MAEFAPGTQLTATDPVCGMELSLEKAAAHEDYRGWAYFFCSQACHRLFQDSPERYAAAPARPVTDRPSGQAGE